MDLNFVTLWGTILAFGAVLWFLRRKAVVRPLPWSGFLIALPVAVLSIILALAAVVDAAGPFSVPVMVLVDLAVCAAVALGALKLLEKKARPAMLWTAALLAMPPVLLAFVPLGDLPTVVDLFVMLGGIAAAIAIPSALAAAKVWPSERPVSKRLAVGVLFVAVVLHGLGAAAAFSFPFTEVRRDLVLDIQVPDGKNATLSVYFPGLAPELEGRLRVTSGNATVGGRGADIVIRTQGPARVEGHDAFYASAPLPEGTPPPVFINASTNVTLHFTAYSGYASGDGCSISVDTILEIRPHRTYPVEPARRCRD